MHVRHVCNGPPPGVMAATKRPVVANHLVYFISSHYSTSLAAVFCSILTRPIFFLTQLEEIKALMEEMDLDSVEVRLEVEVELSSDSECCDADEDGEDDSGDELVSSGSESSDGCEEARFARGVQALSSNSCSDASDSSSGDDEDGMEVGFRGVVAGFLVSSCAVYRALQGSEN